MLTAHARPLSCTLSEESCTWFAGSEYELIEERVLEAKGVEHFHHEGGILDSGRGAVIVAEGLPEGAAFSFYAFTFHCYYNKLLAIDIAAPAGQLKLNPIISV